MREEETGREHAKVCKALGTFKRLSRETDCRKGWIIAHSLLLLQIWKLATEARKEGINVHSN